MKRFFSRWRAAAQVRHDLDFLMNHVTPQSPIRERLSWLVEILQWARSPGTHTVAGLDFQSGQAQALRVRYLLQSLERNPEWKLRAAQTIRSILRDTQALDLFCSVGLPRDTGFFSEALERILSKILPQPPKDNDLGEIFHFMFPSFADAKWIEKISPTAVEEIAELISFEISPAEGEWNTVKRDMEDALLLLISQIRSLALSYPIRKRIAPRGSLRDLPFYGLARHAYDFISNSAWAGDFVEREKNLTNFSASIKLCLDSLDLAYAHLGEFGVNLSIVYQLDRLEALLKRVDILARLLATPTQNSELFKDFIQQLILESSEQKSLSALLSENLSLISKKITDRCAETGEHYITRSRLEYFQLLRSAAGGGIFTAFTALIRYLLDGIHAAYFMKGIFSSMNYASSFVLMQFCGCTLGTKQPAMTANALATKMENLKNEFALRELTDEIVNLIRSQNCAILGNVGLVVPTSILISWAWVKITGQALFDPLQAQSILEDHSVLGLSFYYAACTGVLLWLSSVISGWVDNWVVYREIPDAIAHNRRLRFFIGGNRAEDLANFLRKSTAALASNISLGVLLGMTPKIAGFLGLPIDVRHVTLSAGSVTLAACSLGHEVLKSHTLWLAAAGIVVIGALNLTVSFALAFFVAIRARKVQAPDRSALYHSLFRRILRNPLSLIVPVGIVKSSETLSKP